jgi:hypothetical protein
MKFFIQKRDQLKKSRETQMHSIGEHCFSATSIFVEHVAKTGTCHCQHDIISGPLSTVEVPCDHGDPVHASPVRANRQLREW